MTSPLPPDWGQRREKVLKRDEYECANCGVEDKADTPLHAHHIVPREAGGTHKLSNLITLCKQCHYAVHSSTLQAPTAGPTIDYDTFYQILHTLPENRSDGDQNLLNKYSNQIHEYAGKEDHRYYPSPELEFSIPETTAEEKNIEKSDSKRWRKLSARWESKM